MSGAYTRAGRPVAPGPCARGSGPAGPARNRSARAGPGPGLYLPGSGYNAAWGEYAAWWIQNLWAHYLYTGDRSFLDTHWPTLQKNVARAPEAA